MYPWPPMLLCLGVGFILLAQLCERLLSWMFLIGKFKLNILSNFFRVFSRKNVQPVAETTNKINAYQIVYNDETRRQRDPGFLPLDNFFSEEPDWYEYWPIRNYLHSAKLDESSWYGFVSPNFSQKTGLSGAEVIDFMRFSPAVDVYTFSPFPCHGAMFLNIFEHQDFFFNGFIHHVSDFFKQFDRDIDLKKLVNDSNSMVFSNYFFAKPEFWREWLKICDSLYDQTLDPNHILNSVCLYEKSNGVTKNVPVKVFVMECVASYLLSRRAQFSCLNYPINNMLLTKNFAMRGGVIAHLDSLKQKFKTTGNPKYLSCYREEQERLISETWLAGGISKD